MEKIEPAKPSLFFIEGSGIVETDVERQIKESLSQGERWNVIAKTLHVSNRTIAKVSKKMNEATSSPPPVSEVFTMFEGDNGNPPKTPTDIVKEFNADPEIIEKWFNAWLNMKKGWRDWQVFKAEQSTAKASEKGDGEETQKKGEEQRGWKDYFNPKPKPPFLKET